jgi:hypothetical protein
MTSLNTYLNGIARRNTSMGVGPAVYLLMISGRMICIGIMGIANRARVSFFIPDSINFKPVMESAAANPICSGKIKI